MRRQSFSDWELILADNDSNDGSLRAAQEGISGFPVPAVVVSEKKRGASSARNCGARRARGDWLVFIDADCEPEADWLLELAAAIKAAPDAAALAGCVRPAAPANMVETILSLYTLQPHQERKTHRAYTLLSGGFPTANFAARRDMFERTGGFDESIVIAGEDHDLCRRIYEHGHSILQLPNAVVLHAHRGTIRGLLKQSFGFGLSHGLMMRRMPRGFLIFQMPGKTVEMTLRRPRVRVWCDFNQADKKLLACVLAGVVWHWLFILPALYCAWLSVSVFRRAWQRGMPVARRSAPMLAALLLAKSLALTCGRVAGGFKNGVICV